jgi:hypothetical protein
MIHQTIAIRPKLSRPATLTSQARITFYCYSTLTTHQSIHILTRFLSALYLFTVMIPKMLILDSHDSHIISDTLWLRYSNTYWYCCWSTRLLIRFLLPTSITTLSSSCIHPRTTTNTLYPLSTHFNATAGLYVYCYWIMPCNDATLYSILVLDLHVWPLLLVHVFIRSCRHWPWSYTAVYCQVLSTAELLRVTRF